MLSNFIGEKLIAQEIENFEIKLSNGSLSKIIKNEKVFIKENKFSRIEYEKFLVKNSLDAVSFESNILHETDKKRSNCLILLADGMSSPTNFMINRIISIK